MLLEQVGSEARYWITDKTGFTDGFFDDYGRDVSRTRQLTALNRDLIGWDVDNLLGRDDQTFNRTAAMLLGMSKAAAESEFPANVTGQRHPRSVYTLECSFDGAIPASDLIQARQIDAAFETAHPRYRTIYPSALGEARMMVSYYKSKVLDLIAAKRSSDAAGVINRLWSMAEVKAWLTAWRQEHRRLLALVAATNSIGDA